MIKNGDLKKTWRSSSTEELPGLNHLFQTAKTGAVSEYSQIDETIAPVVLEKISAWCGIYEFLEAVKSYSL